MRKPLIKKPLSLLGIILFVALFFATNVFVAFIVVTFGVTSAWIILPFNGLVLFGALYYTGFIRRRR